MTKPISLFLFIGLSFFAGTLLFGYSLTYRVGYGVFSILALVIAGTFLWLWVQRSTPLALGMAFGWGGAACLMAWWWFYKVLNKPDWMQENPVLFLFLAFYLVGAILHMDVIGRSFALSRTTTYIPIAVAVIVSVAVAIFV